MHTLTAGIVDRMIAIGERGALLEQEASSIDRLNWINRLHWVKWEAATESLSQEDCEHLMRGLVIAERQLKWLGGSVAAPIWIIRVYEQRFSPAHINLARWVLENCGNYNSWLEEVCGNYLESN